VRIPPLPSQASATPCHLYSNTIESPCFDSLVNGTAYSVREYASQEAEYWTNAKISNPSFSKAQNNGFQANFNYIEGENDQGVTIPMTVRSVLSPRQHQDGWRCKLPVEPALTVPSVSGLVSGAGHLPQGRPHGVAGEMRSRDH
jgi:hypothetical protein